MTGKVWLTRILHYHMISLVIIYSCSIVYWLSGINQPHKLTTIYNYRIITTHHVQQHKDTARINTRGKHMWDVHASSGQYPSSICSVHLGQVYSVLQFKKFSRYLFRVFNFRFNLLFAVSRGRKYSP